MNVQVRLYKTTTHALLLAFKLHVKTGANYLHVSSER